MEGKEGRGGGKETGRQAEGRPSNSTLFFVPGVPHIYLSRMHTNNDSG